jgi:hypothetical protein
MAQRSWDQSFEMNPMKMFSIVLAIVNVCSFIATLIYFLIPRSSSTLDKLFLMLRSDEPYSQSITPEDFLRSAPGVGYEVSTASIHSSPESIQYIQQEVLPSTFYKFDSYEVAVNKSGRILYVSIADAPYSKSRLEELYAVPAFSLIAACNFTCIFYYLKRNRVID